MSRHTYLARRKTSANWYFKAKVPTDLVAAFGRKQIWKSLATSDFAEAKRRVRDEADAFDRQCRALRGRAATDARDIVGNVALTSIGEDAIREMVLAWFETTDAERERRHERLIAKDRDEALQVLDQDEQDLMDPDHLSLGGTYQVAVRLMRANDICLVKRPLDPIRQAALPMPFLDPVS